MFRAATTDEERSLMILLTGAELRTADSERILAGDIQADPEAPHITFRNRKMNRGEIAVLARMPLLHRTATRV